jgi:hypothetical protein
VLALFVWGFALYGIFVAMWNAVRYWLQLRKKGVPVTAVLVVQEGASYIEGILRTLMTAEPFVGRDLSVVVIDCGSHDETARIVEAISHKCGTISLVRIDDGDPYRSLADLLKKNGHSVQCVFDLRGKITPGEVVPTLAAFWSDQPALSS